MNEEIRTLQPQIVWNLFGDICSVPHPSKHEDLLIALLMEWGRKHHIACRQDKARNIVFSVPATKGMENRTPVILQAHLDMVTQANKDIVFNPLTDPIETYIDGKWVRAKGTTLGADNGIGVAVALAAMVSDEVKHGPMEVLCTVDEETGMTGVSGVMKNELKGKILLNFDSETEGLLYVGCAGGLDAHLKMKYGELPVPVGYKAVELLVLGLQGGHSGMDINSGRANANKLMSRLLKILIDRYDAHICCIEGGGLRNAIPREARALLLVPEEKLSVCKQSVTKITRIIRSEFALVEPSVQVHLSNSNVMPKKMMTAEAQNLTVNILYALPDGVQRMSDAMEGIVETSINLAKVRAEAGQLSIVLMMRSLVDSAKEQLACRLKAIADLAGAEICFAAEYPGWKPNMASPILNVCKDAYRKEFGEEAKVTAIHAGFEPARLGSTYPEMDMIAFGATIKDLHSPDERLLIPSVDRFWRLLKAVLQQIK